MSKENECLISTNALHQCYIKQPMKKVARRIQRVGETEKSWRLCFFVFIMLIIHFHFFNTSSWFLLADKGCKERGEKRLFYNLFLSGNLFPSNSQFLFFMFSRDPRGANHFLCPLQHKKLGISTHLPVESLDAEKNFVSCRYK